MKDSSTSKNMGSEKPSFANRQLSSDSGFKTQGGKAKCKPTPMTKNIITVVSFLAGLILGVALISL